METSHLHVTEEKSREEMGRRREKEKREEKREREKEDRQAVFPQVGAGVEGTP